MELLPPEVIFLPTQLASFSSEYEKSLLILLEVDNPLSVFAETETTPAPAAIFKEELEF